MNRKKYKASGYSSGGADRNKNTLRSWMPSHYDAKTDIDLNLNVLRDRAADLVMNSPLGAAAVATSTVNVISSGLKLFPRIKAKDLGMTSEQAIEWARKTKQEFELWANSLNCDFYRRNSFYELQRIAYTSYLTDGDCFCLFRRRYPTRNFPYTLRLQLIEAGRVSNPLNNGVKPILGAPYGAEMRLDNGNYIVNGIEVDREGKFLAVWISNKIWNAPLNFDGELKWQRVKIFGDETGKRNILHICADTRTEQFRGVPLLAPVIETIKQVSRYADAELTSTIIKSFFSIFFTQDVQSSGYDLNQILPDGDDRDEQLEKVMREYKLGAGTITSLPRGVDVKAIDRSNAQATFDPFIRAFFQQIGSAIQIPYEVLLKTFQSSYSASRAALLQAENEFRNRRASFIEDFLSPIYENFMTEAVALGRIDAPGFFDDPLTKSLWLSADWFCETSKVLDPLKEIQGAQLRIALGLSTRRREASEMNGSDFFDNIEELAMENQQSEGILPSFEIKKDTAADDAQDDID